MDVRDFLSNTFKPSNKSSELFYLKKFFLLLSTLKLRCARKTHSKIMRKIAINRRINRKSYSLFDAPYSNSNPNGIPMYYDKCKKKPRTLLRSGFLPFISFAKYLHSEKKGKFYPF